MKNSVFVVTSSFHITSGRLNLVIYHYSKAIVCAWFFSYDVFLQSVHSSSLSRIHYARCLSRGCSNPLRILGPVSTINMCWNFTFLAYWIKEDCLPVMYSDDIAIRLFFSLCLKSSLLMIFVDEKFDKCSVQSVLWVWPPLCSLNNLLCFQASEMASFVQAKRDLGCKAPQVTILEEGVNTENSRAKEFWTLLGGKAEYKGAGSENTASVHCGV